MLLILIAAAIVIPQYSDYHARAETSRWVEQMDPVRLKIEENAKKLKTIKGAGKHLDLPKALLSPPPHVTTFEIRDNGEIIIHGGREGQLVIMTPKYAKGKVIWRCLGGPSRDVGCWRGWWSRD